MEQRLQDVLVPKDSVSFEVPLNTTWRREYGSLNLVFGIEYENRKVGLLFKAQPQPDGSITGEFWAGTIPTTAEGTWDLKKLSDLENWNGVHTFEIGHDDDEVFVIEKKHPISISHRFEAHDVGEPLSFLTPAFRWRPRWDVKVKLV